MVGTASGFIRRPIAEGPCNRCGLTFAAWGCPAERGHHRVGHHLLPRGQGLSAWAELAA